MLASLVDISTLLVAIFTGGLLLAAVIAAAFTYVQLKSQARNAKLVRVFALSDRCADPTFMALMTRAQTMFSMFSTDPAAGKKYWTDMKDDPGNFQSNILAVLNFLEEIAGEYRSGLLDRPAANGNVALVAVGAWTQAKGFALWRREESRQDEAWDELEALAREWGKDPIPSWWRRPDTFFQSAHI